MIRLSFQYVAKPETIYQSHKWETNAWSFWFLETDWLDVIAKHSWTLEHNERIGYPHFLNGKTYEEVLCICNRALADMEAAHVIG